MAEFYTYLPGILLAYSVFAVSILSPGPNILTIIGTSMSAGRKSGISLAMGVAFGSLSWGILTLAGLSALLATYASALIAIKLLGGCYLLWLAYRAFKSAASTHDIDAIQLAGGQRTPMGYMMRGYIVQMTNPKAALAWIAIISLGLQPGAPSWVGAIVVGGTFVMSSLAHLLYAVLFSTPLMIRAYSNARRQIQVVLGVFFVGAGIKLLSSRTG